MQTIPMTTTSAPPATAGLDLSDKTVTIVELDASGEKRSSMTIPCTSKALDRWASRYDGRRVVLEVGTHSPWVSRLLQRHDLEVIVANPRRLELISQNDSKSDLVDAELLARLGRMDPSLLAPVVHRSEDLAKHLVILRTRAALVKSRTQLINSARAQVKTLGFRLSGGRSDAFHKRFDELPEELQGSVGDIEREIEIDPTPRPQTPHHRGHSPQLLLLRLSPRAVDRTVRLWQYRARRALGLRARHGDGPRTLPALIQGGPDDPIEASAPPSQL